ncbi:MAG: insulinase family protein [Porticoccaceae bacterium]|nr:insulinase family protein [Porticoccaceae bacterium]MDG1311018.1 insulinase family protein [Porticoccaceae bacterium]
MLMLPRLGKRISLLPIQLLSSLCLGMVLQGCSTGDNPATEVDPKSLSTVIKSPNDDRQYRHIKLANEMDVLLISDSQAETSAASLDVYVGSYQNPKDREGLVHFLEHMLFLGTKDYPTPGDYQTFISEHGGSHNAGTSLENTNYFFDINSEYLEQALDRFAPFFSSPNFDAKYVDRERNAVESEYRLKIKDDGRRQWDVFQEQVDPAHPMSKFTVGNLETLADFDGRPVRDDLLAIYKKYYSANLMKLVVLGKESLDELEAMVVPRFEIVANNNRQVEPHIDRLVAAERLPLVVEFEPLKEVRELSLSFQLPRMQDHWRIKPAGYLGGLIGHEGEGSLVQVLKDRGLIESLSAGLGLQDRSSSMFSIEIGLTPEGFKQRDKIVEMLFFWIQKFQGDNLPRWRYDEQAKMADIAFRFQEKRSPMGYVSSLAGRMQLHPVADVLRANYAMEGWDQELIMQTANALTPDNLFMMVTAPEIEPKKISLRYQAGYSVAPIAKDTLDAWRSPASVAELQVAQRNPYLPDSLQLAESSSAIVVPALLVDQPGLRAWHMLDTKYAVPKAHIIASLGTDKTANVEGLVQAELFLDLVADQLNAQVYPASEAGLSFSIGADNQELSIVVGGYSDKQTVLLGDILTALNNVDWDQARFDRLKQSRLRRWSNFEREYPFRQLMSGLYSMVSGRWTALQKAPALKQVSMEQLQTFAGELLSSLELKVLVSGNHTEQGAREVVGLMSDALNLSEVDNPSSIAKLQTGAATAQIPVDHDDAVMVLYKQGGNDSLKERAQFALLGEMLSAPFYNSLRTEKQLGYVVSAFTSHLGPVPGLTLLAQSPVANEGELRKEFDGFLDSYREQVGALTPEDLQRYQTSILGSLEEKPKNLAEMNGRFLESLNMGYQSFDFRQQLAAAIRDISVLELKEAYGGLLADESRSLWLKTAESDQPNTAVDMRVGSDTYNYEF